LSERGRHPIRLHVCDAKTPETVEAILQLFFLAAIPTFAQGPATPEKQYEILCVANPNPPDWCKTKQQVPFKPLTAEQKALLNGTKPEPVVPPAQKPYQPPTVTPAPTWTAPAAVTPATRTIDADAPETPRVDNTQQRQQAYETGQAMGNVAGALIGNAIRKHQLKNQINKWCEQHPGAEHGWHNSNGQAVTCDVWNSNRGISSLGDLDATGKEKYDVMDKVRVSINEERAILDDNAKTGTTAGPQLLANFADLNKSWTDLRADLCPNHRGCLTPT
jgi:hypothetical protein